MSIITAVRQIFGGAHGRVGEDSLGDAAAMKNRAAVMKYQNVSGINPTFMAAQKLANMTVYDSTVSVKAGKGPGIKRAEMMNDILRRDVTARLNKIVSRAFGVGGVYLKPYTLGGNVYIDVLEQSRVVDVQKSGGVITDIGFLAESFVNETKRYERYEYHSLKDGRCTITQKFFVDGAELKSGATVPQWRDITPCVTIMNVTRPLFASILCPVDDRTSFDNVYGVSIMHGQDDLVRQIMDVLTEFKLEVENKRAFIGMDRLLFREDGKGNYNLPTDSIFMLLEAAGNDEFYKEYSPSIRESSYISVLNYLFGLLEKSIGVDRGIFTNLEVRSATATEIKRSLFDTFALVDSMRRNIETAVEGVLYGIDVLFDVYGICESGGYSPHFDWSYGLVEDTSERFNQLLSTLGTATSVEEMREFLFDEE